MTGKLITIVGPMYAGKTSSILQKILWITHCEQEVLVIKPDIDNRYSHNYIETHNRLSFPCFTMNTWQDVLATYSLDSCKFHTVFLDEVQFMDPKDTVANVETLLANNVDVIAAGLNQDSRGKPFETTAYLMALSDEIELITSICSVCGKPASKTQRLQDRGDRVAVGSVGLYEPRCIAHWTPK